MDWMQVQNQRGFSFLIDTKTLQELFTFSAIEKRCSREQFRNQDNVETF